MALGVLAKKFFDLGSAALGAAADMEMLTTQFEVMLGSSEAADLMMNDLNKFAAATPFALDNLATGTQQLLSFGVGADSVIDTMRMLGDTAGGNAEKLSGLVLAYGKVQTKGKASMEEVNMMAERGLPIYDILAERMNTTKEGLFGLISAGKVGAEDITAAFKKMTSEGGMFYKGMEKQSQTFHGLVSSMKDNFSLALAEAGQSLLPLAKEVVTFLTEVASALGPMLAAVFSVVASVLRPVFKILKAILTPIIAIISVVIRVLGTVLSFIGNVIGALVDLYLAISNYMLAPFRAVIALFVMIYNAIVGTFLKAFQPVIDLFKSLSAELSLRFAPILEGLQMIFMILSEVFSVIFQIVGTLLNPVLEVLGNFFSWIANIIMKYLSPAFEFLGQVFDWVGQKISQFIDWLIAMVNKLPGVNIDRKEIKQRLDARMPSASQRMAAGATPKTTNVSMQNNISMNGTGNTKEDVTRIAESIFTIQLKQVLVDAGI